MSRRGAVFLDDHFRGYFHFSEMSLDQHRAHWCLRATAFHIPGPVLPSYLLAGNNAEPMQVVPVTFTPCVIQCSFLSDSRVLQYFSKCIEVLKDPGNAFYRITTKYIAKAIYRYKVTSSHTMQYVTVFIMSGSGVL